MKKILSLFVLSLVCTPTFGNTVENEMYFRAMKDEMNRTLKELRLPGELRPYYVANRLKEYYSWGAEASLGDVHIDKYARIDPHMPYFQVTSGLKIGNDQNNNTGYNNDSREWDYFAREWGIPFSYEGIRQALWKNTNSLYLEAIEQYKEKEAYRRKKNIKESKPDVIPAPQATYLEAIPPWQPVDHEQLESWVKKVSAWGKEISFLEDFHVSLIQGQSNTYYLNSRGGQAQWALRSYFAEARAVFRQPDGYEERKELEVVLKDFSVPELERAETEIRQFLDQLKSFYGAPEATAYLGPVLYKAPQAARFLEILLLERLSNTAPWWNNADEDTWASPFRKQIGLRVMSPGINVYDRPQVKTYQGIEIASFAPVDLEGVSSEELTLVSGGKLRQVPLSQRPLEAKNHKSNGHALKSIVGRENISTIFVEPQSPLTTQQLEEKLLARCKELGLPYCYISEELGFQRIYTHDGHKEWVVGLYEREWNVRSLRDILAAGDDSTIIQKSYIDANTIITPSLLVDEVDLKPRDRHPDRKPLIEKPQ